MNPPRCEAESYIPFLLAAPRPVTCTEAARAQPDRPNSPAHDSFTRLLKRLEPDAAELWRAAAPLVTRDGGALVLDDSTLDKPDARHMDLVSRHWSGKHRAVVRGINLVTRLWTNGTRHVPCGYRVDHKTKNDHFADLVRAARDRGFRPNVVLFDGWYAGLVENLKLLRTCGWHWLTRLKSNRRVGVDHRCGAVREPDVPAGGLTVHLTGYGEIRVFRAVATNGDAAVWATDDLTMARPPSRR
jgi:putative transposase